MGMIVVGMADLKVAKNPDILTTLGLGSCVGITLYDKIQKIGGLAHVMLPTYKGFEGQNIAKFADDNRAIKSNNPYRRVQELPCRENRWGRAYVRPFAKQRYYEDWRT